MDKLARIQQLTEWLAGTDIAVLELRTPDMQVRLGRGAGPSKDVPVAPPPASQAGTPNVVKSGSVGVFLPAHPLDAAPLAPVGTRVAAGQTVALLRVGALLLPVNADVAGTVMAVPAAPGQPVGYGSALLELQPL